MSKKTRTEKYNRAMRDGNADLAGQIEKSNGVYGYPPEFVSEVLYAMDQGYSHEQALRIANNGLK